VHDLLTFENLAALASLTGLEIVLGLDNLVFIAILTARLPADQQDRARKWGLGMAMFSRIALLLGISWIVGLTQPLFEALGREVSGRDLVLAGGGLFLIAKATFEIHERMEGEPETDTNRRAKSVVSAIAQIMVLDIIFSLDSVVTAVGMSDDIRIMIAAIVIAVIVMLFAAGPVSAFIEKHPTLKVLALSFLLLVGVMLTAEAMGQHIDRGYIYFAMAFSLFVEIVNLRVRAKEIAVPVEPEA